MKFPKTLSPIVEIPLKNEVTLCIKREDLIHPKISGNKFWKLFYNVNLYLEKEKTSPIIITFGGAFSNHIASVAAFGAEYSIKTLGIIRGEELAEKQEGNPTLSLAKKNGMVLDFVSRTEYQSKENLKKIYKKKYPKSLILPEGGTNEDAVFGVKYMLTNETKSFDYLCTAVGTGGTIAGISKYAENHQKIIGFKVVSDDGLSDRIFELSGKENVTLFNTNLGRYGKITDGNIRFINVFFDQFHIPLDPIYNGKMMHALLEKIEEGFFPKNSRILAFHTGGLQAIEGANIFLKQKNRPLINF